MPARCIGHGGPVAVTGKSLAGYVLCAWCRQKGADLKRGKGGRIEYVHPDGRCEGARKRLEGLDTYVATKPYGRTRAC